MPDFVLPDPYAGWSEEKLKSLLRKRTRAMIENERIIAMLAEYAPDALMKLPEAYRHRARLLNAAYRDEPQQTPGA